MTSWALLLLASALMATPGKDIPRVDPGGSSFAECRDSSGEWVGLGHLT